MRDREPKYPYGDMTELPDTFEKLGVSKEAAAIYRAVNKSPGDILYELRIESLFRKNWAGNRTRFFIKDDYLTIVKMDKLDPEPSLKLDLLRPAIPYFMGYIKKDTLEVEDRLIKKLHPIFLSANCAHFGDVFDRCVGANCFRYYDRPDILKQACIDVKAVQQAFEKILDEKQLESYRRLKAEYGDEHVTTGTIDACGCGLSSTIYKWMDSDEFGETVQNAMFF